MSEAEEEEENKSSYSSRSSSKPANMHIHSHRPKRDRQEAVITVRLTTTSLIVLNSPQTKRHSFVSKPRRSRTMAMGVMMKIMTQIESTTMLFLDLTWTYYLVLWNGLAVW